MNFRTRIVVLIAVCLNLYQGGFAAQAQSEPDGALSSESAVTVEIFFVYGCPYCRELSLNTLPRLQAEYADTVRFVARPIAWSESQRVLAVAAECARQQGLFWVLHEPLFDQSESTDVSTLVSLASEYGLDATRFSVCMAEPVMAQLIARQMQEGAAREVFGAPTVFIEGEKIVGAQPYDTFAVAIDRALAEAPSTPVRDLRWLSADQQSLVNDFGYPDLFRLMEVDDLDGLPARYEYWSYLKGNITYLFRNGVFLSATHESYPSGGVLPVPYRPEQFILGESESAIVDSLRQEDVGSFAVGDGFLPGGTLVAGDRLLLGFFDERLVYVETFATTAGGDR